MARAQQFTTMGKGAQAAPSINPGRVSFDVPQAGFVRAAQNDMEALSRASAFFVRDAGDAAEKSFATALRQQRRDTAEFDDKMKDQATVDAKSGAEMDPEAAQFASYADAYRDIKGGNIGASAFGRFMEEAAKSAPADADPVAYARDWAEKNPFTIGDDKFDAAALSQFDGQVQKWALNERSQRVRAAQADGVMELNAGLGRQVQGMELTPEGLQTSYAQARALMPHDPTGAAKTVISGLLGAAKTPEQQQHVMAMLNAPGSFAPGKSYAEQFPQAFAEIEGNFARQRRDQSKWTEAADYDGLDQRITDTLKVAEESGDWTEVPRLLADFNRANDTHGNPARAGATRRKLAVALEKAAKQTATFNLIALAAGDPESRSPEAAKAWKKDGDAFLAARKIDPLSSAPYNGSQIPSSMVAAQAVAAFGAMPKQMKDNVAASITNGDSPESQAAAFSFYRMLERSRGLTFALSQMPTSARVLFQAAQAAVGDTGDAQAWFRNFGSPNLKEEDDIVTMKRITGQKTPALAQTAAEDALSKAIRARIKEGSWLPFQGANGEDVDIAPDVMEALVDDLKVGAVVGLRTGSSDLGTSAKAAAERVITGVQIIPARNGKMRAVMSGEMSDTLSGGEFNQRRVPLALEAINPVTGKAENTTLTAEQDLSSVTEALPGIFGPRASASLFVPPVSTAMGMEWRDRGILPVLNEDRPIVLSAGQKVGLEGLSDDPKKAQEQFLAAIRSGKMSMGEDFVQRPRATGEGFSLFPIRVPSNVPGEYRMTYQVVYLPRFKEKGASIDDREGSFAPPAPKPEPAPPTGVPNRQRLM